MEIPKSPAVISPAPAVKAPNKHSPARDYSQYLHSLCMFIIANLLFWDIYRVSLLIAVDFGIRQFTLKDKGVKVIKASIPSYSALRVVFIQ